MTTDSFRFLFHQIIIVMKIYRLAFLLCIPIIAGLLFAFAVAFPITDSKQKTGAANIVFKSTDGGQTWQDISKGLPEHLQEDGVRGDSIFANDKGLFVRVGNQLYHSTANATATLWTKENFSGQQNSIAPGKSGIFTFKYWGINLKNSNGTSVWSPIFEHFHEPRIRSAFETAGGAIFIGTDRGFFKTTNSGKTWKQVHDGRLVGHLAERDGVLLAISNRRIIRSTDDGENWEFVTSEGAEVFDVKRVNRGFAALTPTSANRRGVSTSYDGGKTWQHGDAGRQDKDVIDSIFRTWNDRPRVQAFQTSISQVGENFFCTHPDGIFKSSDKGKTWTLLLPSVKGKVFNLFGSGNVIYAIRSKGGC
ncbi:WD40/YVTN/BNR-like repeat-containing protein [Lacibacter sp. H407]|uniref:WD40/YVTN/BNR-like repeat-containing protein n=1 Tax=Lacibacter sp. H407 TaxID=3133423 RepID=UPI0030C52756